MKILDRLDIASTLSSYNLAKPMAWEIPASWNICTPVLISSLNPLTKQLMKNSSVNPLVLLANSSNFSWESFTNPCCFSLESSPIGSSNTDSPKRNCKPLLNYDHINVFCVLSNHWNHCMALSFKCITTSFTIFSSSIWLNSKKKRSHL